jgi:hypothetical protein
VIIVGVGGGLIKPMQHRWENMLNKADQEKDKIKAQTSGSGSAVYPTDPTYTTAPTSAVPSAMDAPTSTYGQPRL